MEQKFQYRPVFIKIQFSECVLENVSDFFSQFGLEIDVSKDIFVFVDFSVFFQGFSFKRIDDVFDFHHLVLDHISSWHEMVKVNILNKWLNCDFSLNFLIVHRLVYSSWVSLNAGQQAMAEFSEFWPFIVDFQDHSFLSGVSSCQKNDNSSWFQKFLHWDL